MIFTLSFNDFKQRAGGHIYILEKEDRWCFYSVLQGSEVLKSVVLKSPDQEKNVMFVERNISGKSNIVKIMDAREEGKLDVVDSTDYFSDEVEYLEHVGGEYPPEPLVEDPVDDMGQ